VQDAGRIEESEREHKMVLTRARIAAIRAAIRLDTVARRSRLAAFSAKMLSAMKP
jgi:hypothetical protein